MHMPFSVETDVEDPDFLLKIYLYAAKNRKSGGGEGLDEVDNVCLEEYAESSAAIEAGGFQGGSSLRINLRSRKLANLLIDENGLLNRDVLTRAIDCISRHTYFIGPGGQHDALRQERLLKVLKNLEQSKQLASSLLSIRKPHLHPFADQIIRDTLQLSSKTAITNAHARRAALSALMCYLRQALGSCFATAPAIIVHDEQPMQFLADIAELLNTGKIKRTFSGVEYSVPLCHSWGRGDLKRPFYVSGDPEKGAELLSIQPGFIAAMEIEGGTSPEFSEEQNREILKGMILEFLRGKEPQEQFLLTPEELIKQLLLRRFALAEEELEEFESSSQGGVIAAFRTLELQAGRPTSGKGGAVSCYKAEFARACTAFKALTENALLRAWEYSLASFAETKAQFATWNLYASLGLKHEEPGGIGACLWRILKKKLEELNRKVEDHQFEYEQMAVQVQICENRLRRASSEEEARWLKIDYRAKAQELGVIQELRDKTHFQAKRTAHLFDGMIDFYLAVFPDYFQEIYDPEMADVSLGPYDDSPAGFRLIYKHGRTNTAQWTFITTPEQFSESLVSFFMAAERLMGFDDAFKGLEGVLSEITTEVVNHLRTREFMETALQRMAAAHNVALIENPLENLERVEKKPWVYTSGGNLHTLVSVYFRRDEKPTSEERWVETPLELLCFFVDAVKKMPSSISDSFIANRNRSVLTHSPTHAYLLKPGYEIFSEGWRNESFTYTWVRDRWVVPMDEAVSEIVLSPDMMQALVKRLLPRVPINNRHYFNQCFGFLQGSMSPEVFRNFLVYSFETEKGLQFRNRPVIEASLIDSLLFENLPFFTINKLQENVKRVFSKLPGFSKGQVEEAVGYADMFSNKIWGEPVMGAKQFQQVCIGLAALVLQGTSFPVNYHSEVKRICEEEKLALPRAIIFADTNWVNDHFAFLINPGTRKLELWRVDPLGGEGWPMDQWSRWLDGTQRHPLWGVFINPLQYVG